MQASAQVDSARVITELEQARQRLLDLTMRNKLLNHKPAKISSIRVVDEIPRETYNILVLQERTMEFSAAKESTVDRIVVDADSKTSAEDASDMSEEEASVLWQAPEQDEAVEDRHVDRFLQTNLHEEELQKRLFRIGQQAHTVLEEQGYTVLYLAVGFLEWKESESADKLRKAPLILIPTELTRSKVGAAFKLSWTGEDIFSNISLQAKLADQGIDLPDFEMPEDKASIDSYFDNVSTAIANKSAWRTSCDIYLGFFSFTKFVMFKDLDPTAWPENRTPSDHPLVKQVLDPTEEDGGSGSGFSEDDVDEKLSPRDLYYVMDADPSQIVVTEDLKSGRNLVVEGPPGTGKSQTITNVIAELLAAEKSVLFVSEKMAALEVVKNRLDKVGVGDSCLELHSRKARKKEVLKELDRTTKLKPPKRVDLADDFMQLEQLRDELNDYAKALRLPIGKSCFCPYELFELHEEARQHFEKVERECARLKFKDSVKQEQHQYTEAISKLQQLTDALPLVRPILGHAWLGCYPGIVLPTDQQDIADLVGQTIAALSALRQAINKLVDCTSIRTPKAVKDLNAALRSANVIAASIPTDKDVLLNDAWNRPNDQAQALVDTMSSWQELRANLEDRFKDEAFERNVGELLDEYKTLSVKLLRFFSSRYRYLNREIAAMYKDVRPNKINTVIEDLESLRSCSTLRQELKTSDSVGQSLFGSHWRGVKSDPKRLQSFCEWITSFRKHMLSNALSSSAVELVSSGVSQNEVMEIITELKKRFHTFAAAHKRLSTRIGLKEAEAFGKSASDVAFDDLDARFTRWRDNSSQLQQWTQFLQCCKEAKSTLASCVVGMLRNQDLEPSDVIPTFQSNFADALLRIAFQQRPVLAKFLGEMHNNKRTRFADLDRKLILGNRQRLARKLYEMRPRLSEGASSGSEAGILLGEFGRKRAHMPIRKLLSKAGGLIQKIKPCFMMSPLSIAQFLDPKNTHFDVIIFDEASQVRPEDALGALLRGDQVAVLGDTRQLPPTSFFDSVVDAEEEEDVASVADVESILHQCKRSFQTKTLRWHYRSRHESLIAVSNQEFYDNNLYIYPSSIHEDAYLGLHFNHLSDTVYDRGKSGGNRLEAKAVAQAALEHYRRSPQKSLGVGAFNTKQQQMILEEVEYILRQHPNMQEAFSSARDEHFFVKNLETIQGDERDVILISVGFGFDGDRRFSRNFGPLNQEGGERRLNVLITRAREANVVFSNFTSAHLQVDAGSPFGLLSLKVFLEYAQHRNLRSIVETGGDFDSPFEESVYEYLRSNGHEVHKQVGCASYRVDLAIVDPQLPGHYLLGVECDGARYHSSPVARDRDRLREQVLRNLGWQLYRIWSTDWYRNRSDTKARLLDAVKKAKCDSQARATTRTAPVLQMVREQTIELADDHDLIPEHIDISSSVVTYERYSPKSFARRGDLLETPVREVAAVVKRVVHTESPIALDEAVQRIRHLWKLGRAGSRIRDAIGDAVDLAESTGDIRRDEAGFLWFSNSSGDIKVRRRGAGDPRDIDTICNEEIAEALRLVLKAQHATVPEDLVRQAARLFGFKAVGRVVEERIESVIERLEQQNEIKRQTNGMIDFCDTR